MERAVILITHNQHHANPVGDRIELLKRGRMLGSYAKSDTSIAELTSMMAGGAELEQLSHELQRAIDPSIKEVAKELAAEAQTAEARSPA
jgi:simple sugar transport system ATP-binding protein